MTIRRWWCPICPMGPLSPTVGEMPEQKNGATAPLGASPLMRMAASWFGIREGISTACKVAARCLRAMGGLPLPSVVLSTKKDSAHVVE